MKIIFFARRFYPDIGGVEKHVLEVGKRLVEKGHKVTVITEGKLEESSSHPSSSRLQGTSQVIKSKAENISGIKIIRIYVGKNGWFKKFRIWKNLWSIRDLIKSADVVHCHDVFFWYLPFRFLYLHKKVYTTFHGYESYPIKKKAIIVRKISEKLSWGNICIGDFIKKWYGTKPTYVSYGAVDLPKIIRSKISEQENQSIRQAQDKKSKIKNESAIFIGRLDDQTGILTYVKAVEILKKKFPDFEFTVVGDGKYKKQIEKKVKVLGFQKNPEKHFSNYHFAFVSRYLSILEAFAARKLVFAVYDNPVKEDYLKMSPFAPFIFIEKDSELIVKRITEILSNPEFEEKKIKDAYFFAKKQTWEKVIDTYKRLWTKGKYVI